VDLGGVKTSEKDISSASLEATPIYILLVDDSEYNQFVIKAYLKNTFCRFDVAENGKEALDLFKSNLYDLVLMDIQMPVMDGYAATRAIRAWEKDNDAKRTPIIAMTAYALTGDAQKCFDAGCDAHLPKPITKEKVLDIIREHINIEVPEIRERVHEPLPKNDKHLLLLEKDRSIVVEVDPDFKEIAPKFLASVEQNAAIILNAVEQEDFDTIRILGHTMKGEGKALGFDSLSEFGTLIHDGATHKRAGKIRETVHKLSHYLKRVKIK
jgi:CheY-like chemotaxis protein